MQQLPGLQQLDTKGIVQLIASSIDCEATDSIATLVGSAAAAAISPAQLLGLLRPRYKKLVELWGPWDRLLSLPAVQQFSSQDVGALLQCCVDTKPSKYDNVYADEVLEYLIDSLPAERVDGDVAQRLVAKCIKRQRVDLAAILLHKLPAAQHLSADQVRHLVQLSAPKTAELRKTQIRAALLAVPGTQAAVGEDACLQAVVDALKVLELPHQEPLMDGVRSARVAYVFGYPASDSD